MPEFYNSVPYAPVERKEKVIRRICKHVAYIYAFQLHRLVIVYVILSSQIRSNRGIEYCWLDSPYPILLIPSILPMMVQSVYPQ